MVASSLLSSALALGVANLLGPLDGNLSDKLALLFGLNDSQQAFSNAKWLPRLFNFAALTVISIAAHFVGKKLFGTPRIVAILQVFIASLVFQALLLYCKLPVTFLSFFFAIVFGYVSGLIFRVCDLLEVRRQSQIFELKMVNRQLQEVRLQTAKQDEIDRRLLAADLHDQVLNDLKAVSEKARSMKAFPREDTAKEIERLLQQSMRSIREVMESLSPSILEHLGFVAAVDDCLREAANRGGFKIRFKSEVGSDELSEMTEVEKILLYRLVQECCSNICKHAGANHVRASLDRGNVAGEYCLRIADDGKGMMEHSVGENGSRGLQYMRARAQLIGATIAWLPGLEQSASEGEDGSSDSPGRGTLVEIKWSPESAKSGHNKNSLE